MGRLSIRWFLAAALVSVVAIPAGAQRVITPQIGRFINLKRLPKETPELQVEYARSLLTEGRYDEAIRETEKFDEFYGDTDYADDNQFLRGEIRLAQEKFMDAAKEFQRVLSDYPQTDLFDEVIAKQYEVGDSYYAKGKANLEKGWWHRFKGRPFRKAVTVYSMVIDNQPFTDAAAEAQYKIGLCHFTLEEYVEAAFEYRRVVEDYGQSDWVDDACYGLAVCYYEASLPADYDQAPSQLAVTAIDEFKERFPSDGRGSELGAKRVEMRNLLAQQRLQTAQFYEKRRKFTAATIYYTIVAEEFGETDAANQARAWLQENGAGAGRVDS
ncbi:MAG: outer membrane protein assembly factor BamD [Candidatus Hydrogenedentes bacterium]|nr:outer membrane protein assembly factor BamD [Candidatus Hydrogenedentota bacterium]